MTRSNSRSAMEGTYFPYVPVTYPPTLPCRRVVGQPSSRTSYVVVGADAGPSKLKAIEKNKLPTLDEDGFLDLLATRKVDTSKLDDKTRKKIEKEQEAIRQSAKEMEQREKQAAKASAAAGG